jgi:hypothetical protein
MSPNSNSRGRLRPELELILCCAHTRLSEMEGERIREILHGLLSWVDILATAFENHLESFVYENLKFAAEGFVPATSLDSGTRSASKISQMRRSSEKNSIPVSPANFPAG